MLVSRLKNKSAFALAFRLLKIPPRFLPRLRRGRHLYSTSAFTSSSTSKLSLSHPAVRQYIDSFDASASTQGHGGRTNAHVAPIVAAIHAKQEELAELERMSSTEPNRDLAELARADALGVRAMLQELEAEFFAAVLPPDELEAHGSELILELSAGVGGQEAMLFTQELFDMYVAYVQSRWSLQLLAQGISELGGLRHASLSVAGHGAYAALRYEGGVHRVQRVPATERAGRIHTSTATVAVLPAPSAEAAAGTPLDIPAHELRFETKKASGAGGQHVNTTESAVRITHIPTGISVDSQVERSQIRNKELGLRLLRARLFDARLQAETAATRFARKLQVGGGGRNEKIRTYNWPQDRVTDHRIGATTHDLPGFLAGGKPLETMIERLKEYDRNERLMQMFGQVVGANKAVKA